MVAKAYTVHHLPGRVRFRIPDRRGHRAFFDELERRLRRLRAVTNVTTNPTTGSVLIEHAGDIAELANEALGFDIGELVEIVLAAPPVAHALRKEMAALDGAVRRATRGEMDLGTVAAMGLLAMAGFQLLRSRQPSLAVSLGWYASELLRRSGASDASAAPR